jgi:hypothetical protein
MVHTNLWMAKSRCIIESVRSFGDFHSTLIISLGLQK